MFDCLWKKYALHILNCLTYGCVTNTGELCTIENNFWLLTWDLLPCGSPSFASELVWQLSKHLINCQTNSDAEEGLPHGTWWHQREYLQSLDLFTPYLIAYWCDHSRKWVTFMSRTLEELPNTIISSAIPMVQLNPEYVPWSSYWKASPAKLEPMGVHLSLNLPIGVWKVVKWEDSLSSS